MVLIKDREAKQHASDHSEGAWSNFQKHIEGSAHQSGMVTGPYPVMRQHNTTTTRLSNEKKKNTVRTFYRPNILDYVLMGSHFDFSRR